MVIGLALMGILTAVFLSQTKLMFKTQKTVDAKFVRTQLMQEFSDIIKHPNSKDYAISTTHGQNQDLKKYTNGKKPKVPLTTDVTVKPKAKAFFLDLINPYKEVADEILISFAGGACYDRNGAAIKPVASSCAQPDARWKVTAQWFALAQNNFGIQVKIEPLPSLQLPFLVAKYVDTTNTVSASSSEGETKCYRADENEVFIGCGADGSTLAGEGSTGGSNTFVGLLAGQANTTGFSNTFLGYRAGQASTYASDNTFIGSRAGRDNIAGYFSTFIGVLAGGSNTTGLYNTFIGTRAGGSNTTGHYNTAVGALAGSGGTGNTFLGYRAGRGYTGDSNTFLGYKAGAGGDDDSHGRQGYSNTFIGYEAGTHNNGGYSNTFLGHEAGRDNTSGRENTFLGHEAGKANTGLSNTFIGSRAGRNNTTGWHNTSIGEEAGLGYKTGSYNISIGGSSGCINRSSASNPSPYRCINSQNNIFIGAPYSPSTSTDEIDNLLNIGNVILGKNEGRADPRFGKDRYPASGIKIMGDLEVTGIIKNPTGAIISSSDSRLKKEVKDLKSQLSKLLILKPKTYYWKNKTSSKRKQFGLIAQDVKPIFPNLVHEDESKKKLLSLNYNGLIPVIIQSFKELYSFTTKAIESLKKSLINIETKFTAKNKKLETKFTAKNKKLETKFTAKNKKLERELSFLKKEINLLKKEVNALKKTELDKEKK